MVDGAANVNRVSTDGQFVRKILVPEKPDPEAAMFVLAPGVDVLEIIDDHHVVEAAEYFLGASLGGVFVAAE